VAGTGKASLAQDTPATEGGEGNLEALGKLQLRSQATVGQITPALADLSRDFGFPYKCNGNPLEGFNTGMA
jgi:hypothetical protein